MYLVARALEKTARVSFVTGDWGQRPKENYGDIVVYSSLKLSGHNYLGNFWRFWRILRKIDATYYISSGAGLEVAILALFALIYYKKYIYRTASNIDVNGQYIAKRGLMGKLYKYGLEHAGKIIVSVKEHEKMLAIHHPLTRGKVVYIPLSIPRTIARGEKKKGVLWVSRCVSIKNPDIYLDLAQLFPNERFVMICPRQAQEAQLFQRIKKRAQTMANVFFHDFVPFDKIQPFFDRAKVCINTSDYEGFTFTLLQSGIAGTPVLYYAVDPDGVIENYGLGGLAHSDRESLKNKLDRLLRDEKYWYKCSAAIAFYVERDHSEEKIKKTWQSVVAD